MSLYGNYTQIVLYQIMNYKIRIDKIITIYERSTVIINYFKCKQQWISNIVSSPILFLVFTYWVHRVVYTILDLPYIKHLLVWLSGYRTEHYSLKKIEVGM